MRLRRASPSNRPHREAPRPATLPLGERREEASGEDAVVVEGLTAGYRGQVAVEGISFRAPRGALLGILGPNGSGKSTVIKAMLGLLPAWEGEVRILGGAPKRARGRVGYVPQAEHIDWDFPATVRDVVAMGLYRPGLFAGRFRRADPARIRAALASVGMERFERRQVRELSGGQQRRILIARALVKEPEVLLLDEPAAGLDTGAEAELLQMVLALAREGRTVIVATHDIASVQESYDLALCIDRRQIAFGPAADVLTDAVLHQTFGRQLLVVHNGDDHGHDVTLHQAHRE